MDTRNLDAAILRHRQEQTPESHDALMETGRDYCRSVMKEAADEFIHQTSDWPPTPKWLDTPPDF